MYNNIENSSSLHWRTVLDLAELYNWCGFYQSFLQAKFLRELPPRVEFVYTARQESLGATPTCHRAWTGFFIPPAVVPMHWFLTAAAATVSMCR